MREVRGLTGTTIALRRPRHFDLVGVNGQGEFSPNES